MDILSEKITIIIEHEDRLRSVIKINEFILYSPQLALSLHFLYLE